MPNKCRINAEVILKKGKITNGEYQTINSCYRNTASNDLMSLVEISILKSSDSKGGGHIMNSTDCTNCTFIAQIQCV
jgi:Fic family protein